MLRDLFSLFPAYAGVIPNANLNGGILRPFPRICGGDPDNACFCTVGKVLFPAYAGVILNRTVDALIIPSFPRICGGDPLASQHLCYPPDFSPHMRG